MKITQLRNATLVIEVNQHVILVDPMLAPQGAIPPLKFFTAPRRRNPLVALPEITPALLERVTHCLITHCQKGHFDHLDRAGVKWLRERQIPVLCTEGDAGYLAKKGLNVVALKTQEPMQPFLGGHVDLIPCLHGRGLVGRMMAHGHGYFIQWSGEPSLYLAGDTVLTDEVAACLATRQPDVAVLPAGGARFDIGGDIIMGEQDVLEACRLCTGVVIANHLEALDHCPVTREGLAQRARNEHLKHRLLIPSDGETLLL